MKKIRKKTKLDEEAAVRTALNLIKYRLRSEEELKKRLIEKGYGIDIVNKVIEKAKKSGLVDDKLFAYLYAYDKLTLDKKGPMFIQHKLRELDVDDYLISDALERVKSEVDLIEIATELAKFYYEKKRDILKTKDYLYRRGFEPDIINCVIENLRGD
ncbi:RecX family transcriptional regulator [Petrotoga sp. 9PW.55.5.1]|uniref:regulatory protein RecX n=1 Tax=Petrotoga sp. 9PW.55.5.1 TaxID=1308979 RepID=UPI000DC29D83|nr:regulatory protein RecX [Petrotoga sp. 9PW.55.5.1]RAO98831.1 RecX family transcriptional regulator [Petrotoga sp. 9PW.55.5.1]